MNYTLKEVKKHLKEMSTEIRILKRLRKQDSTEKQNFIKNLEPKFYDDILFNIAKNGCIGNRINYLKYEIRHLHIAYCLFRGRTIEQIESNAKKDRSNYQIEKFQNLIKNAMEELYNARNENVCVNS